MVAQKIAAYTMTADTTFTADDMGIIHRLSPTKNLTITLPLLTPETDYGIVNVSGLFTITVKDSTGAITISTLSAAGSTSNFGNAAAADVPDTVPIP